MKTKSSYIYSICIGLFFIALISVPLLADLLNINKTEAISKQENRVLSGRPTFKVSLLDPYPTAYEQFYNDHFPWRKELSNYLAREIDYKFFKRPPDHDGLYVGKDGWLFTGYERQYWEGTNTYTREEVNSIVAVLHKRTMDYRKKGIRFYVIVPPMKSEIYPEKNPPDYYKRIDSIMTDVIMAAILKDTSITLICGKEALLQAKEKGLLYNITDNHWNYRGAYYAYVKLLERIHRDFSVVYPLTFQDFSFKDSLQPGGNLASQSGLEDIDTEHVPMVKIKNTRAYPAIRVGYPLPPEFTGNTGLEKIWQVNDPALPKAIIIRDSYGEHLIPFISENFRRSIFFFDGWYYGPNWEMMDKEKPDVVILEIFAPHFKYLLRWK